jgi:hypothetical protein
MEAIMPKNAKGPEDVGSKDHLSKAELDRQLNDALKQTFPASDPLTIGEPTATHPDRPIDRKPALLDKELVHELADNAAAKQKVREG